MVVPDVEPGGGDGPRGKMLNVGGQLGTNSKTPPRKLEIVCFFAESLCWKGLMACAGAAQMQTTYPAIIPHTATPAVAYPLLLREHNRRP